jgi:protein gp37
LSPVNSRSEVPQKNQHSLIYGIADRAWQPIAGCDMSLACSKRCWARRTCGRLAQAAHPAVREFHRKVVDGRYYWRGDVLVNEAHLLDPLRWHKPLVVATGYHGDLFHRNLPTAARDRIFAVMALCQHLQFVVLTKRAREMREYIQQITTNPLTRLAEDIADSAGDLMGQMIYIHTPEREKDRLAHEFAVRLDPDNGGWPLPNLTLGLSAWDQPSLEAGVEDLLATPAARRIVSLEPMVGPVDLDSPDPHGAHAFGCGDSECRVSPSCRSIDGVLVGGESGPDSRPMRIEWVESLIDQCRSAGVACHVKQLGCHPVWAGAKASPIQPGRGKNDDPSQWPESLRVQELRNALGDF